MYDLNTIVDALKELETLSVYAVSKKMGISESTLRTWRDIAIEEANANIAIENGMINEGLEMINKLKQTHSRNPYVQEMEATIRPTYTEEEYPKSLDKCVNYSNIFVAVPKLREYLAKRNYEKALFEAESHLDKQFSLFVLTKKALCLYELGIRTMADEIALAHLYYPDMMRLYAKNNSSIEQKDTTEKYLNRYISLYPKSGLKILADWYYKNNDMDKYQELILAALEQRNLTREAEVISDAKKPQETSSKKRGSFASNQPYSSVLKDAINKYGESNLFVVTNSVLKELNRQPDDLFYNLIALELMLMSEYPLYVDTIKKMIRKLKLSETLTEDDVKLLNMIFEVVKQNKIPGHRKVTKIQKHISPLYNKCDQKVLNFTHYSK